MWFCECSAAKNGLQIAKRIFLVFNLAGRVKQKMFCKLTKIPFAVLALLTVYVTDI